MKAPVRGRLAPSPTGVLHLGNARSFLLAWLDARARGGEIVLRVEDLDGPRVKPGAEALALADLRWLGLDWDGPVLRQSERAGHYAAALQSLAEAGLAYPCVCSRKDVEEAASAPHLAHEAPLYPGSCRGRFASAEEARRSSGREPCWRFRVPAAGTAAGRVRFQDRVRGAQDWDAGRDLGDFVIFKHDGLAAYQLAVVVDDAAQGVTAVLRGDDLLVSAARQILLYRALGKPEPEFAHVPLVLGEDGRRLAKRHGDTSLRQFRAAGARAEEVIGWLARVSGLRTAPGPVAARALLSDFDLARLSPSPVIWRGDFAA